MPVNRLRFLFADRHGRRWLLHIDRAGVDMGKGPRTLVKLGRYSAACQLVVPDELAVPEPANEAGIGARTLYDQSQSFGGRNPNVADEPVFALKGSTAINLFLPRHVFVRPTPLAGGSSAM